MPFPDKTEEQILLGGAIVAVLCIILIVAAWILLMITAHKLSYAKLYGERKRNACGNEYLELETARYELDLIYNAKIGKMIKAGMVILYTVCLIVIVVAAVMLIEPAFSDYLRHWPFMKAVANASTEPKRLIWYKFYGCLVIIVLVLAVLGTYLAVYIKEVSSKRTSKYIKVATPKSTAIERVKMITLTVSMIISLWLVTLANHLVGASEANQKAYMQVAAMFSIVVAAAAIFILVIHGHHKTLQQNIEVRYNTVKSNLQSSALALRANPDFVKSLQINIKRVIPNFDGDPNINDPALVNKLYAYLEHRPGNDLTGIQTKYISVKDLKTQFQKFLIKENVKSLDFRHSVLALLQSMYAPSVDGNTIFAKSAITASVTKFTDYTTEVKSIIDKVNNLNQPNDALSYNVLRGIVKTVFKQDNELASKVNNAMRWFIHYTDYKEDSTINFETIYLTLDNEANKNKNNTKYAMLIGNIKYHMQKYEVQRSTNTALQTLNIHMRDARAAEKDVTTAVNKYVSRVSWLTYLIIGIVVYAGMHLLYDKYKSQLVMAVCMMILVGIFAVTWYAWFFAKLKL